MRANEFLPNLRESAGATTSGAISTVAQPLGMVSRTVNTKPAKYANSYVTQERKKPHAR